MNSEPGLFDAGRRLTSTALLIFQSRLELAAIEVSEAGRRFYRTLAIGLVGLLLLLCGLLALSLCVVWLLWPQIGLWALVGMGVIYMLVGVLVLMKLAASIQASPPLLGQTQTELRRDAAVLRGAPIAPDQ